MISKEFKSIDTAVSRDEKRQQLRIVRLGSVGSFKPVFKSFSSSPETEKLIDQTVKNQENLLIGIIHGVNQKESHFRLTGVDLNKALVSLDEEGVQFELSCFDRGRKVRELIYHAAKQEIVSLSDFFYFKHLQGGEGVVQLVHKIVEPQIVEILYQPVITQESISNHENREKLTALVLKKFPDSTKISTHETRWQDGFRAFQESTYSDGVETGRLVEFSSEDRSRYAMYTFKISESAESELIIRKVDEKEDIDEQWGLRDKRLARLDYSPLMLHLLKSDGGLNWGPQPNPVIHLSHYDNCFEAEIDGNYVKSIPVVDNLGRQVSSEEVDFLIFPYGPSRQLHVYFDFYGTLNNWEWVNPTELKFPTPKRIIPTGLAG